MSRRVAAAPAPTAGQIQRPPFTVEVRQVPMPADFDLDRWCEDLVRIAMEVEGIRPAGALRVREVG